MSAASRVAPLLLALAGSVALLQAAGPEPIDHAVNARIRAEARERSQIMQTLHVLTDLYGPRLTGSPNHKAAAEWAVAEMQAWGFDAGRLEEWDFGHPGWLNERLTAHVVAPVKDALVGEALAWTNGTDGPVRAPVAQLILPERPTEADLEAYLDSQAAAVAGRIGWWAPAHRCRSTSRRRRSAATTMTSSRCSTRSTRGPRSTDPQRQPTDRPPKASHRG